MKRKDEKFREICVGGLQSRLEFCRFYACVHCGCRRVARLKSVNCGNSRRTKAAWGVEVVRSAPVPGRSSMARERRAGISRNHRACARCCDRGTVALRWRWRGGRARSGRDGCGVRMRRSAAPLTLPVHASDGLIWVRPSPGAATSEMAELFAGGSRDRIFCQRTCARPGQWHACVAQDSK